VRPPTIHLPGGPSGSPARRWRSAGVAVRHRTAFTAAGWTSSPRAGVRYLAARPSWGSLRRSVSTKAFGATAGLVSRTGRGCDADIPKARTSSRRPQLGPRQYGALVVGRTGWRALVKHERLTLLSQAVPGALGLVLRMTLTPACSRLRPQRGFGQNVVLRHPGQDPHRRQRGHRQQLCWTQGTPTGDHHRQRRLRGRNTILSCKNGDIALAIGPTRLSTARSSREPRVARARCAARGVLLRRRRRPRLSDTSKAVLERAAHRRRRHRGRRVGWARVRRSSTASPLARTPSSARRRCPRSPYPSTRSPSAFPRR